MIPIKDFQHILRGRIPGQLVVQYADHCNAACPQCGMRVTHAYQRSRLDIDSVKEMIDHAAQQNFKAISFTGGEPLLFFDEIAELMRHAGQAGISYIRTGTNGFIFRNSDHPSFEAKIHKFSEKLANTPVRNFWISIDSAVPHVHEKMRGLDGVFAGIEKALPILHSHGIYPSANLGINRNIGGEAALAPPPQTVSKQYYLERFYRNFTRGLEQFYDRMICMGFSMINTCYPMSAEYDNNPTNGTSAVYAAASDNFVVNFSPEEKVLIFKGLMDTIPAYRSRIRIFSPLCSLLSLQRQHAGDESAPFPCRGGMDFFFIDANHGDLFPCGYRGDENLGKFTKLNRQEPPLDKKCLNCDWECFRDPSEMFGPLLLGIQKPTELIKKLAFDFEFIKHWLTDLAYYRACDYFNGRMPINDKKLKSFEVKPAPETISLLHRLHLRRSF